MYIHIGPRKKAKINNSHTNKHTSDNKTHSFEDLGIYIAICMMQTSIQ